MKKLNLKKLKLDQSDLLDREELKVVLGGVGKDDSQCWVKCKSGVQVTVIDCDFWADWACGNDGGWSICTC